nr:8243_t:CDS:2 [Entrophospora candida]
MNYKKFRRDALEELEKYIKECSINQNGCINKMILDYLKKAASPRHEQNSLGYINWEKVSNFINGYEMVVCAMKLEYSGTCL